MNPEYFKKKLDEVPRVTREDLLEFLLDLGMHLETLPAVQVIEYLPVQEEAMQALRKFRYNYPTISALRPMWHEAERSVRVLADKVLMLVRTPMSLPLRLPEQNLVSLSQWQHDEKTWLEVNTFHYERSITPETAVFDGFTEDRTVFVRTTLRKDLDKLTACHVIDLIGEEYFGPWYFLNFEDLSGQVTTEEEAIAYEIQVTLQALREGAALGPPIE